MNKLMANSILRTAYHNKKGDLIIKNSGFYVDENNKLVEIDIPTAYKIALEALEKQIPKKIILFDACEESTLECPSCGCSDIAYKYEKYCPICGQKLDWGEQNA